MRKLLWIAALAVPVVVLVTLPAGLVRHTVALPEPVTDLRGTVWSGQARWRQPGQAPLDIGWHYRPPRNWSWRVHGGDTELSGMLVPGSGGMRLVDVSGDLSPERLDLEQWLPGVRATGTFQVQDLQVHSRSGSLPEIQGLLIWRDAALAGTVNARLGRVEIRFGDVGPGPESTAAMATFQSLDPAEVRVRGRVERQGDSYRLEARLQAASSRPDLADALARLGRPLPEGGVLVEYQGPLGW